MKYTLAFTAIIIGMFILQSTIPSFTDNLILNESSWEQPYRFVTAIFLHGGITHIAFNLFAILIFGFLLEKLIGSKKFFILFLTSGIIANLISINFYPSSLGASGAIMGIIGTLAILRPKMMVWAFGVILPMWIAAILWIIGDTLGIFIPDNTGNIAHLSGIAIGILYGLLIRVKYKTRNQKRQVLKIPEHYARAWENTYMR